MTRVRAAVTGSAVAGVVALCLSGCDSTRVTAARLQDSIAPTFASLYVQQQVAQGNPRPVPGDLRSRASCQKGPPSQIQQGAGNDWVCNVTYLADGPATAVTAIYNVTVQTNGCYAADGDGPTLLNGRRTITGPGYRQVVNPLWLIDDASTSDESDFPGSSVWRPVRRTNIPTRLTLPSVVDEV